MDCIISLQGCVVRGEWWVLRKPLPLISRRRHQLQSQRKWGSRNSHSSATLHFSADPELRAELAAKTRRSMICGSRSRLYEKNEHQIRWIWKRIKSNEEQMTAFMAQFQQHPLKISFLCYFYSNLNTFFLLFLRIWIFLIIFRILIFLFEYFYFILN